MIDVGEQDKALAQQIERDQAALAAIHETVQATRLATEDLRVETAAQKKKLDKSMRELKREQAKLKKLEKAAKRELARQKAAYYQLAKNKKGLKKAIARAQASQRALAKRIDRIIEQQRARGNIPSKFNGSFRWPLVGRVSGEFGCSSYPGYAPGYGCAHFHNGIDIVAGFGAPGPGRRQRHGRVHRLELRGRIRSGLDRGHRPRVQPADLVRPPATEAPGIAWSARERRSGHRLRRPHGEHDRSAPPLDGRAQRGLEEPALVPLAALAGRFAAGPGRGGTVVAGPVVARYSHVAKRPNRGPTSRPDMHPGTFWQRSGLQGPTAGARGCLSFTAASIWRSIEGQVSAQVITGKHWVAMVTDFTARYQCRQGFGSQPRINRA
jgi:hypothetical protein